MACSSLEVSRAPHSLSLGMERELMGAWMSLESQRWRCHVQVDDSSVLVHRGIAETTKL